jgi:hypothetical protein
VIVQRLARFERSAGAKAIDRGRLVAAGYLSPRTRELLNEANTGWFDATGNFQLHLNRPALLIDRQGASRNPFTDAEDRRLRSLRGPGAARVVRTLLDERGPLGVRDLAMRAEVGPATSSRVLELLARDDLVERDRRGAVTKVRKRSLARRWAEDYGLTTTSNAVSVLAPRGIDRLVRDFAAYPQSYALTASAAHRAYLPAGQASVAPLSLVAAFVDDAPAAIQDLHLRMADRGANVLLIEPFDHVVYRNHCVKEQIRYVSVGQVVVDLLTGPGRSPEEGEQLLGVLADSDEEWAQ